MGNVCERQGLRGRHAEAFMGAAQRFHHMKRRWAEALAGQILRRRGNGIAIAQQDNGALGGCDMGAQAVQRRCVQAEAGRFLDRPAQPGGSKAEGRWRGVRNPFRRTEMARKACACAEPERIAR